MGKNITTQVVSISTKKNSPITILRQFLSQIGDMALYSRPTNTQNKLVISLLNTQIDK